MDAKTILILGGYGPAGLPTARLLLEHSRCRVILAGRDGAAAERAATELNTRTESRRASGIRLDAASDRDIGEALEPADMVVVCAPVADCVERIARAALAAGADYLDIIYPPGKLAVLQAMAPAILQAGRCFITEAGSHPGLPAAMVRYAAGQFDRMDKAAVAMVVGLRPEEARRPSVREALECTSEYESVVFRDGQWRKAGWRDARKIDFGKGFGVRSCWPLGLEEMKALPAMLGLREAGLYAAGFNWFVDVVVFPSAVVLGWIRRGLGAGVLARLMAWGTARFGRPPYGMVMKLEASGTKAGREHRFDLTLRADHGYAMTAIPTAACLLQYLDGTIARPGLCYMGHAIDAGRLMDDMKRMGLDVEASLDGIDTARFHSPINSARSRTSA